MNEQVFKNPRRSVQTLGLGIPSHFVKLRVKVQKSIQNWSSFYSSGIEVWPRTMSANGGWGSSSSKKYFIFCTVVLVSDLLVVLDAREAKRNELGSCLKGIKNQVGELDLKLWLFHFNYCHFSKGFSHYSTILNSVILNSLYVSSSIWTDSVDCIVSWQCVSCFGWKQTSCVEQ